METTSGLDELRAASLKFLVSVKVSKRTKYGTHHMNSGSSPLKARFGDSSPQLHDVHETLALFRKGQVSKRDAHITILSTLEGNNDLRQQLMDIIMHPAADWAHGDFDLPTEQSMQPLMESTPQYLQPAHQPQMRLPSISSSWFPMPQVDQSPSHLSFGGYDEFNSMISSPSTNLAPLHLPYPTSNLWMDHNMELTYPVATSDAQISLPIHTAFRNPWQDANCADTLSNDAVSLLPESKYIGEHTEPYESSIKYSSDHPQLPGICSRDAGSDQSAGPLLHDSLSPMPASQSTYHLPQYSVNSHAFLKSSVQGEWPANVQVPPTLMSHPPPEVQQTRCDEDPERDTLTERHDSMVGLYVHALCGKAFTTLSGVKKHHWGKKVNDLESTTGCWAKHKKPDVAWDDHPSCKGLQFASETPRSLPSSFTQGQSMVLLPQAEVQPASNQPQCNTVPGFPTLEDLPKTVAKTLNTSIRGASGLEEWEPRYHTHRLPSRSSFDTLLTAISMVSQIDAPKPEARTDSIALHPDAQVATAEQHAPFLPYIPSENTFDRTSVRPNASTTPDTKVLAPGLGSGRRLPVNSEGHAASASLSWIHEPLASPSLGSAKKKRRV